MDLYKRQSKKLKQLLNKPFQRFILLIIMVATFFLLASCGASIKSTEMDANQSEQISVFKSMPVNGKLTIATPYFKESGVLTQHCHKMLLEARRMFIEKYPGWTVDVVSEEEITSINQLLGDVSGSADMTAWHRYYNELPNKLRGEAGPDIVAMAFAQRESFINDGLLLDLSPLMAEDNDTGWSQLLPGIRTALTDERGLFSIPASFTFDVLMVDGYQYEKNGLNANLLKESITAEHERMGLQTWEDISSFFKLEMKRLNVEYLLSLTPQAFVQSFLWDYQASQYDFNNPYFKQLLQTAYDLNRQGLLFRAGTSEDSMLYTYPLTGSISNFNNLSLTSGDVCLPLPAINSDKGIAIRLMEEYAINANANEKAAAWEFIKILWSPELQNSDRMYWQPVLAELNEDYIKRAVYTPYTQITTIEVEQYNRDRLAFFSGISGVQGAEMASPAWDTIEVYLTQYFLDELTLDETINALQNEITQ